MSIDLGRQNIFENAQPLLFQSGPSYEYIRVRNESPLELSLNFTGVGSQSLGAWLQSDIFVGVKTFTGQLTITGVLLNTQTSDPTNFIACTAFGFGELPNPITINLMREVNTTPVSLVVSDGFPVGFNVVYARPAGDINPQGCTVINNEGFISLGDPFASGSLQIVGPTQQTSVLATGTLDLTDTNGANALLLAASGIGIDMSASTLITTCIKLLTGSLTRISKFSGTANTTPTFFNHGLGAVPDIVLVQGNGTSATVHTFFVDYATLTNTQAKITNDSAGGTPFVAYAIKS